ncbi:MAG: coiled coil domain-containing protein [Methylophaga sp.]|uniref:coiled coil domain-containing protein n=1 Tax=Methylophaga sp. TaxID=2024840 RepID=UPI00299F2AD3|nr:coiled coil domain-containing protein [Methylophaga sp.]MDX1748842.1 coiled coil domain-containing protein [Methylophaga sp.]
MSLWVRKRPTKKKLQAQLDEWALEIDKLKTKADKADAEAQLEYYKQIENLRSMQEKSSQKLAELKAASDDAWEDIKAGSDSAWDSLSHALKLAISRFK